MKGVLITGGAKRIGAAITRALAADGWFVYVHCREARDEGEELLREIEGDGGAGQVCIADFAATDGAQNLFAQVDAGTAPLTALVNNASLFEHDEIFDLTPENFERHARINLLAPLMLSKLFAAAAPQGADACIVNMLDNKIFSLNPDYFSYTISKLGLHGATQAMAMAMAPNVRVNGIAPGITLPSAGQSAESFARCQAASPLGRGCTPDEIVGAVRFILSTPAFNGQVITIDGGQSLQHLPRDIAFLAGDKD